MSEILTNRDAVLLAASERFVYLGQLGAERLVNGKQDKKQFDDAWLIELFMHAYENNSEMTDDDVESILYCLRKLSGESVLPTVSPFIGQALQYVIDNQEIIDLTIQNNSVDLANRIRLNFLYDLQAEDTGSVINVSLRDPEAVVSVAGATITLDLELKRRKSFYGSANITTAKAMAFSNDTPSREFDFHFSINAGVGLTITGMMADGRRVAGVWTSPDAGSFWMRGRKVNGTWWIVISESVFTA